jgi:hypothetical protein
VYGIFFYDMALNVDRTQTIKLREPFAITKLAIIPTHEKYLELLERHLPNMQFSHTPAKLTRHGWRSDTLWSTLYIYQTADFLGVGWSVARPLRLMLLAGGATWRFWSIYQARVALNSMTDIVKQHDAHKDPKRKLDYLKLARLRMIKSPSHPVWLSEGMGVALVVAAIQSLSLLGDTEQVDQLVPIVEDLWEAKRASEMRFHGEWLAGHHFGMSEVVVHEIFVTAPAKVRWVAGDNTVEEDYFEMIARRQESWELRKKERNSTKPFVDRM